MKQEQFINRLREYVASDDVWPNEGQERAMAERKPDPIVAPEGLKDSLAKRLNTLTAQLVAVSCVALIVFIANVDGRDYREDYEALKLLDNLPTSDISAANPEYKFNDWLAANHPTLLRQCNQARQILIDQLDAAGFPRNQTLRSIDSAPASFSAVDIVFAEDETKQLSERRRGYGIKEAKNVGEQLDRFELLHKARRLAVATMISFPKPSPVPVQHPPNSSTVRAFHADATRHAVVLTLFHPPRPGDRSNGHTQDITCPTTFVEAGELSLARALGVQSDASLLLYNDGERRGRLRTIYGALDLDNAKVIASEQAVRAYKQIDLLGLSFSTKRVPIAIMSILSFLSAGIFVTLRQAAHRRAKVITEATEDSAIGLIVDWFPTRCAAFVVLPLVAVWASLPPFRLGAVEIVCLVAGSATILILGIASVRSARKL